MDYTHPLKIRVIDKQWFPAWHIGGESEDSRDGEIILRNLPNSDGPVGWSLQLGKANPVRDITLYEVLVLCATPNAGNVPWSFIKPHLTLIKNLQSYVSVMAFHSQQNIARYHVDIIANRLRDLIRLRKEAFYARGFFAAGDSRIKMINDALSPSAEEQRRSGI